jgi:hypothetical protein
MNQMEALTNSASYAYTHYRINAVDDLNQTNQMNQIDKACA